MIIEPQHLSGAFPAYPINDSFGRVVTPFPGLSKLEYFAYELYKLRYEDYSPEYCMKAAHEFIIAADKYIAENLPSASAGGSVPMIPKIIKE